MSPRSTSENEKIRIESKGKILHAAFKLIAVNGYEETSISQIARKAGISKGLVYNYYSSKEELLKSLIEHASSEIDTIMQVLVSENPSDTLRNMFQWFFDDIEHEIAKWRLITELAFKIDKFDFARELALKKVDEFTNLISELLDQIGIDNPEHEARVIAALFDGIGLQYMVCGNTYPLEEMKNFLISKYCI